MKEEKSSSDDNDDEKKHDQKPLAAEAASDDAKDTGGGSGSGIGPGTSNAKKEEEEAVDEKKQKRPADASAAKSAQAEEEKKAAQQAPAAAAAAASPAAFGKTDSNSNSNSKTSRNTNTPLQQDVVRAVASSHGDRENAKLAAEAAAEAGEDGTGIRFTSAEDDEVPLHLRSRFAPGNSNSNNSKSNSTQGSNGNAHGHGRRPTETSLPPGAYHIQPGMSATRRDLIDRMDNSGGLGGDSNAGSSGSNQLNENQHASQPTAISALTFNIADVEANGNGYGNGNSNHNHNNNNNNRGPSGMNGDPAVEAYAVTPDEEATQAVVLNTVCGVERKRFVVMAFAALLVLAAVLAIAIPISRRNAANANAAAEEVCGPICGLDVLTPPDLDRVVLGKTCEEWNRISLDTPISGSGLGPDDTNSNATTSTSAGSTNLDESSGLCDPLFRLAAYGCGCSSSSPDDMPSDITTATTEGGSAGAATTGTGCGMLCTSSGTADNSRLPDPSLVVGPIRHFTEKLLADGYDVTSSDLLQLGASTTFTCGDWELLSLFETDDAKCPAYNALGHLCGCPSNQPHPDACGPLCDGGDDFVFNSQTNIYGATCQDWDALSRFLPSWYDNPNDEESCEEHYWDVKYGCACPESRKPPPFESEPECGALCQQLRTCPAICGEGGGEDSEDGGQAMSQMVDPSKTVRRDTCYGWEMLSRVSPDPSLCPFYRMMGAQCGCDVAEPDNSFSNICGAFCGGDIGNVPELDRMVAGETCEDWYYKSTYLPVNHGSQVTGFVFNKLEGCDEIKRIQFGCGCDNVEPPEENCGRLCGDGSELPDPLRIVGGRPCGDWEMLSLFESNLETCDKYHIVRGTCGCDDIDEYPYPCFEYEQLADRTWYYGGGGNFQFYFDFTEDGHFGLVVNSNELFTNVVGFFQGWGSGHAENVVAFGGGVFCGANGPATALVNIVEDETVTEPTIVVVNEPAICTYHAEMRVPKFCEPRREEL